MTVIIELMLAVMVCIGTFTFFGFLTYCFWMYYPVDVARQRFTEMRYVYKIARIKQIAKSKGIDLDAESKALATKKNLEVTLEQELVDEIGEAEPDETEDKKE